MNKLEKHEQEADEKKCKEVAELAAFVGRNITIQILGFADLVERDYAGVHANTIKQVFAAKLKSIIQDRFNEQT